MNKEKQKALEAAGFWVGDAEDWLDEAEKTAIVNFHAGNMN